MDEELRMDAPFAASGQDDDDDDDGDDQSSAASSDEVGGGKWWDMNGPSCALGCPDGSWRWPAP